MMGIVGCYSMDLYCDECAKRDDYIPHYERQVFTGHTAGQCMRGARRMGWLLNPRGENDNSLGSGKALCPNHSGKKRG